MIVNKLDETSKSMIYRRLRRSIIMGNRESGGRLNVDELADEYNTSVTPVREALQILNHEGLVDIKPRSGYFVARISLKQLRDLLDVRRILELSAVERAARRVSPELICEMRAVHGGYTGDNDEDYDRYTDENRHFHYLLGMASGNHELAEMIGRLHDQLARFMVMRRAGPTLEKTHARIIDAIEAGDMDAARQALLDDIDPAHDAILDDIMEGEAKFWQI
jgi:DNA-binding GntR family transcriptional regulator